MMTDSPTLLSSLQQFQRHDVLDSQTIHPFAWSVEKSCANLQDLIQTVDQVAASLNIYTSVPFANSKLVSLLRQQVSISHALHASKQNARQTTEALRKRADTQYGEDIPLEPTLVTEWCIDRLEVWGASLGMETFKDDGREGVTTVVLGGKVLVVDVDFTTDRNSPGNPRVMASNVKTSYAITNGNSNASGSVSLDAFLLNDLQHFCAEVQKPAQLRDPDEAATLRSTIVNRLKYLITLDKLAASEAKEGQRWFLETDRLCPTLEKLAKAESQAVASSLSVRTTPLDIFLLRSHGFPLPYQSSPSLSFLLHLSPTAYLILKKASDASQSSNSRDDSRLDITVSALRSFLISHRQGVTVATLTLIAQAEPPMIPSSVSMPSLSARPMFSLVPGGMDLDHVFPKSEPPANMSTDQPRYSWFLDFTGGGEHPGIVLSQTRLRDIELIVNPFASVEPLGTANLMSFGLGTWVDLLLNPDGVVSSERYTTTYVRFSAGPAQPVSDKDQTSPTSVHPPLQLRLAAPDEPGFRLERVPVQSLKEVWGVIEVVREQCWLNETLCGLQWVPESPDINGNVPAEEAEATQEELQAVLNGTITPIKIPVNVYLPPSSMTLFEAAELELALPPRPRIVMSSPERPPISGLVEISVTLDETRPRGVCVNVTGAMGADLKSETLEEICRRGGALSLPGRVWASTRVSL